MARHRTGTRLDSVSRHRNTDGCRDIDLSWWRSDAHPITMNTPRMQSSILEREFNSVVDAALKQSNVLYLRPVIQERNLVSSGSWFSPRSAVPPHNGVGDWCLKKVRCEVTWVQAHRHSTARSSGLRPDGTSVHPDGRIRLVAISCRQLLFGPGEGRVITPDAGHDDSQFSRRGNDSFLHSLPGDQPHGPCFER